MTALADLLAGFRAAAVTEREKGTYFEELILAYLRNEASYRDLYSDVWTFADWAKAHGKDGKDKGIDLVAKTRDTDEFHAIQCKFYAADYKIQKADIDSFFTASGQKPFVHRLIVSTTDHWSSNAEDALHGQQVPVSKITLYDLENSQIDWAKFKPHAKAAPPLRAKKSPFAHQRSAIDRTLFSGSLSRAIADLAGVQGPVRADAESFATSVSVDEARRATILALDELLSEASETGWDGYGAAPVHPATVAQAIAFLRLLPTRVPAPEITASPSGEVSFHWSTSRTRVMSVAVSPTGRLTFAALVGDSRNYGSEALSDELPQSIALPLQRVLGSGTDR